MSQVMEDLEWIGKNYITLSKNKKPFLLEISQEFNNIKSYILLQQQKIDELEKQKNNSVILRNINPSDILLLELNTRLSTDLRNRRTEELAKEIGCKVVIIDGGLKEVKSIPNDIVELIQSKIDVDKLVEKINKKLAENM